MTVPYQLQDPSWDKDDLKSRVDLRDLVAERWGEGNARGNYVMYRARWREDHNQPSFAVYADGFKDFGGSGEAGDVYTWLERELGLSFPEAVRWLHDRLYGATIALPPRRLPEQASRLPSDDWQQAAQAILARCQRYLWTGQPDAERARAYLRDMRGLTDATIRDYGLGYCPRRVPTDVRYLANEQERRAGLMPGIVIPWRRRGALVALRVRCRVGDLARALGQPDDTLRGEPLSKYRSLRGSRLGGMLFNRDRLTPGGRALVVEGEFDAMLASQLLGDDVTVVTPGSASSNLSRRLREQLQLQRQVILLLDSDGAGQSASARLQTLLGDVCVALRLPAGKDVTEFVLRHDGDLTDLVKSA